MRLFQTEKIQKDSSFVESCGFSLGGRVGFEHSGKGWAGKGIPEGGNSLCEGRVCKCQSA